MKLKSAVHLLWGVLFLSAWGGVPFEGDDHPDRPDPSLQVIQIFLTEHLHAQTRGRASRNDLALSSVQFRRKSSSRGQWRGRVSGTGLVKLYLNLYAAGRPVGQKYIGSVRLEESDGPILFSFLSDTPRNTRWKWKIVAQQG